MSDLINYIDDYQGEGFCADQEFLTRSEVEAIAGRGKGWRKAVRYVLTENPVSDYRPKTIELPLFKLGEETAEWQVSTVATNGGK